MWVILKMIQKGVLISGRGGCFIVCLVSCAHFQYSTKKSTQLGDSAIVCVLQMSGPRRYRCSSMQSLLGSLIKLPHSHCWDHCQG